MAKFYGEIGFSETSEVRPGVWVDGITRKNYYGDANRVSRRLQSSTNLNDDIIVNNEISIIADPYANENFHAIRYAVYMGTKWKVTSVDVQYPRLILTLGGVYNEQS